MRTKKWQIPSYIKTWLFIIEQVAPWQPFLCKTGEERTELCLLKFVLNWHTWRDNCVADNWQMACLHQSDLLVQIPQFFPCPGHSKQFYTCMDCSKVQIGHSVGMSRSSLNSVFGTNVWLSIVCIITRHVLQSCGCSSVVECLPGILETIG